MPLTSPGNDDDTGENHQPTLRKNTAEPVEQTLKQNKAREGVSDIDEWRNRPLGREYAYLFMDGVWHKRCWGGGMENASVLAAIGVGADGGQEVLAVAEVMKEDAESWHSFVFVQ